MITAVSLLSLPSKLTGGGMFIPNMSFSESAKYGLIAGLVHGIFMALVIYWRGTDSIIGTSLSSIFVTEVLIAIGFIVGFWIQYLNQPASMGTPPTSPTYLDYGGFIFTIVFWFIIFSILFLIPSIVIGIANRMSSVFTSN